MTADESWREVLRALVETVLAFDHPAFPAIEVAEVERRVLEYFPADAATRGALMAFDEIGRFSTVDPITRQAEAEALAADGPCAPGEIGGAVEEKARVEAARFEAFVREFGAAHRFAAATLPARRAYLRLWAKSGFAIRRRLYATFKGMVLIPAYSLPALWRAVGYAGPAGGGDAND